LEQIEKVCKPKLENNEADMERLERDIFQLKKNIEQLEIQKLAIEQKFIEQNYLSDDYHQQNTINSYAIFNEKNADFNSSLQEDFAKTLNLRNIDKEGTSYLKVDNEDEKGTTWKNIELSPIKDETSVLTQKKYMFYENPRNYQSVSSVHYMSNMQDYISSGANSTHSLNQQQFIRRSTMRSDQIEEISLQNSNHRRFESVPGMMSTLEKSKGSNVPIKVTNNFNVSIKKLMDTSMEKRKPAPEAYVSHKPRSSYVSGMSRKEEDYLNMPLQKHRSSQSLSEQFNPHGNYRVSPELTKTINSKGQEIRMNNNGPLKTIDEEGTYRDTQKNLKKLGILAPQAFLQGQTTKTISKQGPVIASYKDNIKRQQNATLKKNASLGNSISLEGTTATDHNNSFMNSQSVNSLEYNSASAYRSLQRNHSSSKPFQSTQVDRLNDSSSRNSGIFAYQTLPAPASSYGTRSKSLGAPNKNLSFEGSIEENLGDFIPHPSLSNINLANYASVQSYKQDTLTRHLQGRSMGSKNPSSSKLRERCPSQDQNLIETVKNKRYFILNFV